MALPRRPQHRIHNHALGLTKRQIQKLVLLSIVGIWVLVLIVYTFSDDCHTRWHIKLLCDEYAQGMIAGGLCHELCVTQAVYLSSCEKDGHGNLVFSVNDSLVIKTRDRFSETTSSFSNIYKVPEVGTQMEDFRKMVSNHLVTKLGEGDHSELARTLLDIADSNHDNKVSLAEAKSLWALLRHNDFLLLVILRHNYHTPVVRGHCGEIYQVDMMPKYHYLYTDPKSSYLGLVFPWIYSLQHPKWTARAKIAVGILEFALDVYQHQNDGSFYLCNLNESNIGYTQKHDAIIHDLSMVLPRATVDSYIKDVKCTTDSNCRLTDHCTMRCDPDSKTCSSHLVQPNLSLVCQILKPYLFPDIPKPIRADFLNLIFQCIKLETKTRDFEVQHSLILNDLKSLLWRQISSEV